MLNTGALKKRALVCRFTAEPEVGFGLPFYEGSLACGSLAWAGGSLACGSLAPLWRARSPAARSPAAFVQAAVPCKSRRVKEELVRARFTPVGARGRHRALAESGKPNAALSEAEAASQMPLYVSQKAASHLPLYGGRKRQVAGRFLVSGPKRPLPRMEEEIAVTRESDVKSHLSGPPRSLGNLQRKKVAIAINNEEYLRAHPELRTLIHGFVCVLVERKPRDVSAFASAWFTQPGLAASLGLSGWERSEDEAELAAAAVAAAAGGRGLLAGGVHAGAAGGSGAGAASGGGGGGGGAGSREGVARWDTSGASMHELEKQLVALFAESDKGGNGALDQKEFKALMATSSLGLRPTELRRLLAEADEDADGNVSYAKFVPIAMEVLHAMRAREAVSAAERELDSAAEAAASQLVNGYSAQHASPRRG